VMRHFSLLPTTPACLTSGMHAPALPCALITTAGLANRTATRQGGAAFKAVGVFVIAAQADADLPATPSAVIEPIARLDRHRLATAARLDSATPSRHAHNTRWEYCDRLDRSDEEGPRDSDPPGLRLLGRAALLHCRPRAGQRPRSVYITPRIGGSLTPPSCCSTSADSIARSVNDSEDASRSSSDLRGSSSPSTRADPRATDREADEQSTTLHHFPGLYLPGTWLLLHAARVRSTVSLSPRARSNSMIVSIFGLPRRDRVR
jgi:hypothetical protein